MPRAILLAEDNDDDVFFFTTAAKKAGWTERIVVARDGREAIEQLRRIADGEPDAPTFALALLDLKMPFVGGLEVLEWARGKSELRAIPMVMLTSSEQESDIAAAYRHGAASFLVKPSQPERMGDLVRLLQAYWLQANRLPTSPVQRPARAEPAQTR